MVIVLVGADVRYVLVLQVNGLSNLFWGWGREDDELYVRMKEAGMTVSTLSLSLSVYLCVHMLWT